MINLPKLQLCSRWCTSLLHVPQYQLRSRRCSNQIRMELRRRRHSHRSGRQQSLPLTMVSISSPLPCSPTCAWVAQIDMEQWLRMKFNSLEKDGVALNQDALWHKIQSERSGLLTKIAWREGKIELRTRQVSQHWEVNWKRISMVAAATERSDVTSRAERWSNVNNLSGWLILQGEKIRRSSPDFSVDDLKHLENQIREFPAGHSATIDWTNGTWHLKIRQHGDIWQAMCIMEERTSAMVAAPLRPSALTRPSLEAKHRKPSATPSGH